MTDHHSSLEEYEARARTGMEEAIRQGMDPELAEASYEADMAAETYGERWHDWAEAQFWAAVEAEEAEAAASADPRPEPDAEPEAEF
jgi:hypothetical protein